MSARERVGRVFVKLTQKLYGGDITEKGDNDSEIGNIDIINWERNQGYESKGSISSDHHKLQPNQVQHNRNLREMADFPLDHPEVYYMFWQYTFRGISRIDESEMERTLLGATRRLLVVSFDIVEAGTKYWDTTGKNSWGEVYMFRSSQRRSLTENTDQELERMNLKPENYLVTKEKVCKGTYRYNPQFTERYGWISVPDIELTTVINKSWKGLDRS